jgi:DMSO/TMAO reductase YedYZ molybdopterin-dependent catalytic subunit
MISRRGFLKGVAVSFAMSTGRFFEPKYIFGMDFIGPKGLPEGTLRESVIAVLPGKKPLIKRSYRPPNYETPVRYFNDIFTPNDVFFVRYHLSNIPQVDVRRWRLRIGGDAVDKPLELSMDDLKRSFEPVEIAALNQCSGNRRGLFSPHVPGVQWGYGAMGNARWKGVRLRDILNRAGIRAGALEVTLNGADGPVLPATPDFVKSIPIWKAINENTLVAYEMNGEPLPQWNGFPARVIVPGWTATYWVKHITDINVISKSFDGYWIKKAYRIPSSRFPIVERFISQETEVDTPITEMVVNSLITNIEDGQIFRLGHAIEIRGVAWDGGYGIKTVEVSTDGGRGWQNAELGRDYGRFSWRQWSFVFRPPRRSKYTVMAKATNRIGQTQTFELIWNPAGYHNNVVQGVGVSVV